MGKKSHTELIKNKSLYRYQEFPEAKRNKIKLHKLFFLTRIVFLF